MYLSRLTLDPQSRRTHSELTYPYEMHRSLMKAFSFSEGKNNGRVLYQVDLKKHKENPVVYVVSEEEPQWYKLRETIEYIIDVKIRKDYPPKLEINQNLYFRLRANPTVCRNSKRKGLFREEEQLNWLSHKAKVSGFKIIDVRRIDERNTTSKIHRQNNVTHQVNICLALFEGIIQVVDLVKFSNSLKVGIGPAKAFGCGLLLIKKIV